MTETKQFLAILEPADGAPDRWQSEALTLPDVRVLAVRNADGRLLPFAPAEEGLALSAGGSGRVEARSGSGRPPLQKRIRTADAVYEERGRAAR